MSDLSFQNFGAMAKNITDPTLATGRYGLQKEAERNIVKDVVTKLDIRASDSMLEIGCGIGNLLIPLSFSVKSITGIDHPDCISKLRKRIPLESNVNLYGDNFFNVKLDGLFDKILVYSVLQYMTDWQELMTFVSKTLEMLVPGGKVLFGDIPNTSRKDRFLKSNSGKNFESEWSRLRESSEQASPISYSQEEDDRIVVFNDESVLNLIASIRNKGYHAYILPQPPELPFGNTREDILVECLA